MCRNPFSLSHSLSLNNEHKRSTLYWFELLIVWIMFRFITFVFRFFFVVIVLKCIIFLSWSNCMLLLLMFRWCCCCNFVNNSYTVCVWLTYAFYVCCIMIIVFAVSISSSGQNLTLMVMSMSVLACVFVSRNFLFLLFPNALTFSFHFIFICNALTKLLRYFTFYSCCVLHLLFFF